jgi:dimethylargininase
MLKAITRAVSPAIGQCELHVLARVEIDVAKAAAQHQAYQRALAEAGLAVTSLPPQPDLPDSVFVEDPAVVLDEIAVMTRMGALSRRPESESLAEALCAFRPLRWMSEPATLEGGDVMRIGRRLFAGLSARTNSQGIEQLGALTEEFGYTVVPVRVKGCLHLKSACTPLGGDAIVANRAMLDMAPLAGLRVIDVAPQEPWAGNTLSIDGTLLIPSAYPRTAELLARAGYRVRALDISELMKAEAGLTCSSLIFET